ncbi:MAG: septum formation initiator family protein [Synergistaceae bacterium]|jgi:cell division protein FtsL|nr:septum formation initiator family protein [Synergistaceae bacterium]
MKAPLARHERMVRSHSMICVICLFGVLASAMSLGSLRLYGLYLEHRLAYVTTKIEKTDNKNAALEERYSSLLSPSRIYNYARLELNMSTAHEIETIKLNATPMSETSVAALTAEDIRQLIGPEGIVSLFVGTANAKD